MADQIATLRLSLVPVTLTEAMPWVRRVHRHLKPPQGARWAIGLNRGDELVGVAIVGNPPRMLQDRYTAAVTRVAVIEGVKNANSKLKATDKEKLAALRQGLQEIVQEMVDEHPSVDRDYIDRAIEDAQGAAEDALEYREQWQREHPEDAKP